MSDGIDKLKSGDFNRMSQEWLDDTTVIVTLSKRGEDKVYRFKVRNLYQKGEEVLEEEIIGGAL